MKNKKLFSILGVAALLVAGNFAKQEAEVVDAAEGSTLYLTPNAAWKNNNARFAIYTWGGSAGEKWISMTDADGDQTYEGVLPSGYKNVIFCSMKGNTTVNNWNNKTYQTSDLTFDGTKNLYTLNNTGNSGSWSVYAAEINVNDIVSDYYNSGKYTKRTKINLSAEGEEEFGQYFHGDLQLDRTTYFNKDALLMCDYDGNVIDGEGHINSGYGTVTNTNLSTIQAQFPNAEVGDMTHFKYVNDSAKYDYIVKNTHKNWDDSSKAGMEGFYLTLNDLSTGSYFDNTWTNVSDKKFEHEVTNIKDDKYLEAFLAIAAPCLTDAVSNSNMYIVDKLVVDSVDGELKLQIILNKACSGMVDNADCVLAEALIEKGHTKTIYFVNDWDWSGTNFYCYLWDVANNSWPGDKMDSVGKYTTSNGEKDSYKLKVDLSLWKNVIFTNNQNQTVDIPLNSSTVAATNAFMPFYDTADTYTCFVY